MPHDFADLLYFFSFYVLAGGLIVCIIKKIKKDPEKINFWDIAQLMGLYFGIICVNILYGMHRSHPKFLAQFLSYLQ